jgi:predicted CoA-binding protein
MMDPQSCRLPDPDEQLDQQVRRMLAAQRIAVVGLSDDPSRPSYGVARYLRSVGKEIVPVNPSHQTVFGLTCYPSLEAVPGPIDLVDVFRRAEYCPDVARSAIAVGAKGVWLQSGIVSDEARQLARKAGIDYVEDRCLMVDHMHFGQTRG